MSVWNSRITSLGGIIFVLVSVASPAYAQSSNPTACNELFNLPQGTITRSDDKKVMTEEVCAAYKFLISRYSSPGSCSQKGLSNPQVEGITRLNPDFAVALAKMLKAMPGNIGINSAFRTSGPGGGQSCANPSSPNSNHTVGCAVDLAYPASDDCNSTACRWARQNAQSFGLVLRMPRNPEWNHIEPADVQVCRTKGPGGGVGTGGAAPSGGISGAIRQALGLQQPAPSTPALQQYPQPMQPAQQQQVQSAFQTPSTVPVGSSGSTGVSSNLLTTTNISTQPLPTQLATSSTGTSTLDLLNLFANPFLATSTTIGTATPITLTLATMIDIATINGTQTPTVSASGSATIVSVQPTNAQQTFTSSDLSYSASQNIRQSATWQTLENMRQVLVKVLDYLKPFNRTWSGGSIQTYAE